MALRLYQGTTGVLEEGKRKICMVVTKPAISGSDDKVAAISSSSSKSSGDIATAKNKKRKTNNTK